MPITGAPSPWTIEVWNKGATTLIRTLTFPSFPAPAVDARNSIGTFSFRCPLFDPTNAGNPNADAVASNPALGREIRLFRGASWAAATYKWAGRIWHDAVDFRSWTVTFSCWSLLDYMRDRFIDRGATRTHLLPNADFESGSTGWTDVATTATVVTTDHVLGTHSVELVQAAVDADAYRYQDFTYTSGSEGDIVTIPFWFKIVSWTGPALANHGLTVEQLSGGVPIAGTFASADINWNTPRGTWQKTNITTFVPPSTTVTIRVGLASIQGTIRWDAGDSVLFESLSLLNHEQASIGANIIAFAQDTTKGKDPLGISSSAPSTGIFRDRTYQFADHISALSALQEFPRLADGYDFQITPDRVFTTYALPAGIGADKTATVTLTFGANCEPTVRNFDGPSGASDVTTLGNGSGPGREEGGAVDNTLFGGVTVQQILPAPNPDVMPDILAPWAARQLTVFKDPTTFEVIVTDRTLGFSLGIGDRVTLAGSVGYVQESGHARIVAISADPVTDLPTLTLNRAA